MLFREQSARPKVERQVGTSKAWVWHGMRVTNLKVVSLFNSKKVLGGCAGLAKLCSAPTMRKCASAFVIAVPFRVFFRRKTLRYKPLATVVMEFCFVASPRA